MRAEFVGTCESCGAPGHGGYYVRQSSLTLCDGCAVQAGFDVSTDQGESGPAGSASA